MAPAGAVWCQIRVIPSARVGIELHVLPVTTTGPRIILLIAPANARPKSLSTPASLNVLYVQCTCRRVCSVSTAHSLRVSTQARPYFWTGHSSGWNSASLCLSLSTMEEPSFAELLAMRQQSGKRARQSQPEQAEADDPPAPSSKRHRPAEAPEPGLSKRHRPAEATEAEHSTARASFHRENKNRPTETTAKRPVARHRDVLQTGSG